ncbi:hypothetical protein ACFXTO_029602 [Malus domestica]
MAAPRSAAPSHILPSVIAPPFSLSASSSTRWTTSPLRPRHWPATTSSRRLGTSSRQKLSPTRPSTTEPTSLSTAHISPAATKATKSLNDAVLRLSVRKPRNAPSSSVGSTTIWSPGPRTRISAAHLETAKQHAAFRVVIVDGRLYVDLFWACVQSRAMFTIWGFLQLLARYPGRVPDVDIMFDCMDKPIINRTEHESMPLPLFRYCTDGDHFDIPFPDWSFWGWPELNIHPWEEQFGEIKRGSQERSWKKKEPFAYWKGNPDVSSPIRTELLNCNDTKMWRAQIMRQDWEAEARAGYEHSKLSTQCNHQYKIYAEGYAWSVSLKYIVSCGSLTLIITPQYEDFFSRGLIPKINYWPISPNAICPSIKSAVDWAQGHQSEAKAMGQRGQDFMESLSMDRVYDYMFHLIMEYSKLLDFEPDIPASAMEVCTESLLCLADPKQREWLKRSTAYPSPSPPCTLPSADSNLIKRWKRKKQETMDAVEDMNPKGRRR